MAVKANEKTKVELAIKIVDEWHADSRNFTKEEPDGLKLARLVIKDGE